MLCPGSIAPRRHPECHPPRRVVGRRNYPSGPSVPPTLIDRWRHMSYCRMLVRDTQILYYYTKPNMIFICKMNPKAIFIPPFHVSGSGWGQQSHYSFLFLIDLILNTYIHTHPILGLTVESYGTGTQVRLPGKSAMEPRIFKFGTPYAEMYRSLAATPEDEAYFLHNGVLQLCKRGSSVKV